MSSDLDQQQIIQQLYDETQNRLRVDCQLTSSIITPPGLEVAISSVDDNIAIRNTGNGNELLINANGSINNNSSQSGIWNINNITGTVSLPTGASTSANQLTGNTSLSSIDTKLSSLSVSVNNFPNNQNVTVTNTPSVNSIQSGSWNTGRTWNLLNTTDSVNVGNFPSTFGVTQSTNPWIISGTVTSNIGTTNGLALDSSLSTIDSDIKASQPRKIQDSAGNSLTSTSGSLNVNITNSPSVSISNFPAIQTINGTVNTNQSFQTRSDTFLTTGNGVTIDISLAPLKIYSLQVVITGTVSVWDVRLEGSLDNVNFTQILQHTNTTGNGITVYSGSALSSSLYFRSRCAGFTGLGGSSLVAVILGTQ